MTATQPVKLLTMEEWCALARIPLNTGRYYRAMGKGPRGVRFGRRVMFREDECVAWINAAFEEAGNG
ncbi:MULTISPECIES: DNA-binding protein [Arthrobacter]|uniref:DNA-binding protein n=2 Tax=Arthrobacter TaxID=1663 RepID=A0ABU9KHH7_9MICC|nr:DNA-binding protein [Arthrobacter sp. YJM1]MDP5226639.1 DNA-binding protein [Arthrobacter sp. YJM1]